MNYKELIDPELRKSANSFPFNPAIVAVGNLYQDLEWGRTEWRKRRLSRKARRNFP